ncbi:MerR family transcriptional regulator [Ideonella sp. BN130291]|uniref:MerR family transcriptional regulator n=1 Tax=Ideonella sp. BN130291 TaxID=3112940 RepID=UPI002E26C2AA|nr:MerR family transcriptional regulator [Ideonella sp. BN130291]
MLKIGELARQAGLTVRTLHHYHHIGLLSPTARSDGGYRLYGQADIERLHAIQALRQLKLPLEDIARLLDGGVAMPVIVDQQLDALDREIRQAQALQVRLQLLKQKFGRGELPQQEDWLASLRLMNACQPHFSAKELKVILGNLPLVAGELRLLMALVREKMDAGVPPDGLDIQPLVHRWMTLMAVWMNDDLGLMRRWGEVYRRHHADMGGSGPDLGMVAYLDRAIEHRIEALSRYVSMEEITRMARVPLAQWQAIAERAAQAVAANEPLQGPAARQLACDWLGLIDRLTRGDTGLRDRLITAYRESEVLAAAAAIPPEGRRFLEAAAVHHQLLDPAVA